ncbi:MAG: hypothetical protein QE271_08470 [Bacteriovoracaceae bacterium]|nr:hypothetical protein [Bacteriovoracaceae bacterium]
MTKILFLTFVLFFSHATLFAKGFDCQSLCIVLDSKNLIIHFLGEVEIRAGTQRKEAHRLLKNQCKILARNWGFYFGSVLVDTLDFRSTHEHDSEIQQSRYSSNDQWTSVAAGRAQSTRGSTTYSGFQIEHNRASSEGESYYHHEFDNRELDIRLTPSQANVACTANASIADEEIPYLGDLDVH